ncbi:hypothetical protein BofuT4_uP088560.1 [Botrytis cinerea T4]|uniref:Uncharacterized protein n=1 Tax=Botryotinia fuckeliana (strain T4) TaxID=999810 RepID=G2YG95_BOTF4|nr:hypothetical protein BofuT4_uP088560.1 [Botrytis cinerea T4]
MAKRANRPIARSAPALYAGTSLIVLPCWTLLNPPSRSFVSCPSSRRRRKIHCWRSDHRATLARKLLCCMDSGLRLFEPIRQSMSR